jgi:O-acetyl-ADP-ribose deacetylase (regulator of RNase III)
MIRVERGDIATVEADAVLRPVTSEWMAVTPAMRRLELALGLRLLEQCQATGDLPVGTALVTPAGELAFELAVHVAVRSATEPVSAGGMVRALRAGLRRLEEWGVRRVAMPPLGTGAGNLEIEESADLAIPVLVEQQATSPFPEDVIIVVESEYEQDVFERRLRQAYAVREPGPVRTGSS